MYIYSDFANTQEKTWESTAAHVHIAIACYSILEEHTDRNLVYLLHILHVYVAIYVQITAYFLFLLLVNFCVTWDFSLFASNLLLWKISSSFPFFLFRLCIKKCYFGDEPECICLHEQKLSENPEAMNLISLHIFFGSFQEFSIFIETAGQGLFYLE